VVWEGFPLFNMGAQKKLGGSSWAEGYRGSKEQKLSFISSASSLRLKEEPYRGG
jgi:hypothetical protein